MNDRLKKLKKRKNQIEARIMASEARSNNQTRKDDTRRKILVGAIVLENAKRNGTMDDLIKKIDPYLTRKNDRKLFGLL
jgi:large subunit ribosomal protein L7/L12